MKDKKKNISSIIRYTLGIIFIIAMLGMTSEDVLASLFMGLFGVSLLPVVYDKFLYTSCKLEKKTYLHIIIPIILFLLMSVCMGTETPTTAQIENTTNNTITNESIDNNLVENEDEYSKEENTQNTEVDKETNNAITEESNTENKEENIISTTTTHNYSKQQITSSAPKEDEPKQEITSIPSTPKEEIKQETTTTPSVPVVEETKKEETTPSQNTSNSKTVYRTPSGKRYHLDPDCGGKNSYSTTLDSAISSGLTPCQKCAS